MKRRKAGNEAEPKAPLPTDREKRDTAEAQPAREQKTEPAPAVKPDPAPTTKPPETATDVDKAAKPAKQRSGPELEIQFKPESATLGLANLMLRGELKVVNIGKAMARNVTLTSGAICAGPKQEQAIAEFFEDDIVAQPIDNIRKGEKLSIEIEIMMPRGELASYAFQGREICVPIILAELSYTGIKEGSDRGARLATIIGCEAKPKAEKLGPLRLDQGPRSFSELGQREIAV